MDNERKGNTGISRHRTQLIRIATGELCHQAYYIRKVTYSKTGNTIKKQSAGHEPALCHLTKTTTNPYKPDSVIPPGGETVIIYLALPLLVRSSCQPTYIGRAALNRTPIWHYSAQGLPHIAVACLMRRLLLYVFTLTSVSGGGYFLWHSL